MYKIYCYTFIRGNPGNTPREVFSYVGDNVETFCPDFKTWKHYPAQNKKFEDVEWQYVKDNIFVKKELE